MKTFISAIAFCFIVNALKADIKWIGVTSSGASGISVCLSDPANGLQSRWVEIGGHFGKYTISNFNKTDHTLTLTDGKENLILALVGQATPVNEPVAIADGKMAISVGGQKTAVDLNFDHESIVELKDGTKCAIMLKRTPDPSRLLYQVKVDKPTAGGVITSKKYMFMVGVDESVTVPKPDIDMNFSFSKMKQ